MSAIQKYQPKTDLGMLFSAALGEVERLRMKPAELTARLEVAYRSYIQAEPDWNPRADPIYGQYLSATKLLVDPLVKLRGCRKGQRFFPTLMEAPVLFIGWGLMYLVLSGAYLTWAMIIWFFAEATATRWMREYLTQMGYNKGLLGLLGTADELGERLPALPLPAGSPLRQLPPKQSGGPL